MFAIEIIFNPEFVVFIPFARPYVKDEEPPRSREPLGTLMLVYGFRH